MKYLFLLLLFSFPMTQLVGMTSSVLGRAFLEEERTDVVHESTERRVAIIPERDSQREEDASGLVLENRSHYLDNLRKRLWAEGKITLSYQQDDILEEERIVNKTALAEGVLPNELAVLRAEEYYHYISSVYQGAKNSTDYFSIGDTSDEATQAFEAERILLGQKEEAAERLEQVKQDLSLGQSRVVAAIPL